MDMFTTRTMLAMVEEGQKSNSTWLRDRYFTNRPTFNTQKIDFDIIGRGGRKVAPFVNPKVGGVVLKRSTPPRARRSAPQKFLARTCPTSTTSSRVVKRSCAPRLFSRAR